MVTLACGPAGGWRGCVVSCALVFTLCRDQGDDRRRTAGPWAGRVLLWDALGAEHWEALRVFGAYITAQHRFWFALGSHLPSCAGLLCWVRDGTYDGAEVYPSSVGWHRGEGGHCSDQEVTRVPQLCDAAL